MKFSMSEAWRDATAMMTANREVLLVVAGDVLPAAWPRAGPAAAGLAGQAMIADPQERGRQRCSRASSPQWGCCCLLGADRGRCWRRSSVTSRMLALLRDDEPADGGRSAQDRPCGLAPGDRRTTSLVGLAFVVLVRW